MKRELLILDACALIAFFNGEDGAGVVLTLFKEAEAGNLKICLHAINLCEVYYDCLRKSGSKIANKLLKRVKQLPLEIVEIVDMKLIKEVGRFKASEKISLADAFALGLSAIRKGKVVTSDHREFDIVEKNGLAKFLWIR